MGRITGLKNPGIIVPCFITLARLKRAQGDVEEALRTIESGKKLLGDSNTLWSYFFNVFIAELYLFNGDSACAAKWLAVERIGIFDMISVSREFEYIVYARYLILENRLDEALILLGRLEEFTKHEDRLASSIKVLILTAICNNKMGETTNAMLSIEKALSLGITDGYVRIFVDENRSMEELLFKYKAWVKQTGNNQYLEYSKNLLKLIKENIRIQKSAELSKENTLPGSKPAANLFSERELTVLKLMVAELSNQEIAQRLFITVRTVKYYNARIFDKLGVNNRLEAIIKAKELGIEN